jgi:hypothetical protein
MIVLKPIFITNFEPRGDILLEKNRTAKGKDSSSSREKRYSERIFTFIFLLLFTRIFSQVFTKCENRVESLIGGMQIHLFIYRNIITLDYKYKTVRIILLHEITAIGALICLVLSCT